MSERQQDPTRRAAHLHVVAADGGQGSDAAARAPAGTTGSADGTPADAAAPSLDEAYRRYARYVAAVAVRILGRDDELDDLVQDVFLDATRGLASLRDPEAIRGWLGRIAVRAAVRRLRKRRLRRVLLLTPEPDAYETLASPDASPEQRTQVARVYRALDALPPDERVAWVLRHVQGETLEAAAVLCDCSLSTYQRRLRRAAGRLSKELPGG